MNKIDLALAYFGLEENFTLEKLNEKYEDLKSLKNDRTDFHYAILKVAYRLQTLLRDVSLESEQIKLPEPVMEFYNNKDYHRSISSIFHLIKEDLKFLDKDLGNAKTVNDIELADNNFFDIAIEGYKIFFDSVLGICCRNKSVNKDLIYCEKINEVLSDISMKSVVLSIYKIVNNRRTFDSTSRKMIMESFKIELESYFELGSEKYNKGLKYYSQMLLTKSDEEVNEIYNKAKNELFGRGSR